MVLVESREKKRLRYFRFRFKKKDFSVIFLDIGGFSLVQVNQLARLGLNALEEKEVKEIGRWPISRPEGAIKRSFVMHEGKILKFD